MILDLDKLTKIAIQAALSAGNVIRESRNKHIEVDAKNAGSSLASQVVTDVDRACESVILDRLKESCEELDIALLSEETEDNGSRFQKEYFWCIDPMDGTLAFINGYPGFAVSIALVSRDGIPQIGVVYDPSTDILYHAIKGSGAFKNGKPWTLKRKNDYLTYVTDKALKDTPRLSELKVILNGYTDRFGLNGYKEMAGAGSVLNAIHVLKNGPAILLKFPKKEQGGGSLWDFAATACMYGELGVQATDFGGERLDLNKKENTYMNEKGVCFANLI